MKRNSLLASMTLSVMTCLLLAPRSAHADQVTDISIASYYGGGGVFPSGNWADALGGATIVASPTNGNQGTGLNFGNWTGHFSEVDQSSSRTFSFAPVTLNGNAVVNTLINTFYGSTQTEAVVTFGNSLGQTATYSLVGDQTIRDYNQSVYANDLLGYNLDPTLGAVTTQEWWTNYSGSGGQDQIQRLDAQTFVLPTSWAGTSLTSLTINDPNNSNADDVLSAVQVNDRSTATTAVTPEPASWVLLGTGMAGMLGAVRRRLVRG